MLHFTFVIIFLLLPQYAQSSCCRLPFTDGECQVNRKGPHRYQIMPDRRSGVVTESTECHINDFDASYRKVVETKNYCNDCPGLLIIHANSSEIFLFPEYLERILEGRTPMQRKNVVILTTSLVGSYDLDFTFFSRYYASRSVADVPSLYVDLQLPPFNPQLEHQPDLRLRLPVYSDDKEGFAKISRQELINPLDTSGSAAANIHQLPYLYHFDIEKHRNPPSMCTLYNVEVSSTSLVWKMLDSQVGTCHTFMPYFGRNKCFATGFTRLFCPIEDSISTDDNLRLSLYVKATNRVEHLTIAVTGGRHVIMALSNSQMRPAEQVKILLLQGHLAVTDINLNMSIRVEYGWDCNEYSLAVPAGFSATRYRRFDGENLVMFEGNSVITLPSCFKVIPSSAPVRSTIVTSTHLPSSSFDASGLDELESDEESVTTSDSAESNIIIESDLNNTTRDDEPNIFVRYWNILRSDNNLVYAGIVLLVLVALIPLCLGVCYRVYCTRGRKSNWTLEHFSHTNPAYNNSKDDGIKIPDHYHINSATQTTDTAIRI